MKITPSHIALKLLNSSNKKKFLNAVQKKKNIHISLADFSLEIIQEDSRTFFF